MIVVEHKLVELFNQIPEVYISGTNVSKTPTFGWGNKEELEKFIKGFKSDLYPLIWLLITPETHNIRNNTVSKNCVFILASLELNTERYNAERFVNNYAETLNPLTEYVLHALDTSSITTVTDLNNIKVLKEPNYSETENDGVIDKWDAVRLEIDVEFNNNCLKQIKWQE